MKIGLVAPFEGRYRELGYEVIYAVRLAVREANRAGGAGGYSVELAAFDDSGDEQMAEEQARKLAADPDVALVIGHFLNPTTSAALPDYAEAGLPVLTPAVTLADLSEGRGVAFRPSASPQILAGQAARFARDTLHAPQVQVVVEDDPALASAFEEALTDSGLWAGAEAASFAVCGCRLEDGAEAAGELRAASPDLAIVGGPEWGLVQFRSLVGEASTGGMYFTAPGLAPEDVAGGEAFMAAYLAISQGVQPGWLAVLAYDAARTALAAVENDIQTNGAPSRAGALAALRVVRYRGLNGEIVFDEQGEWENAPGRVYAVP